MLERLLKVEEQIVRIEAMLLVFLVIFMLGLATYNVFYRNVLVPIQVSLLTDADSSVAPPVEAPVEAPTKASPAEPAEDGAGFGGGFEDSEDGAGAGGFGGGFGDDEDSAEGFGGGFGDDTEASDKPAEPAKPSDDTAGFGGGFGDEEETKPAPEPTPQPAEDDSAGFGGGFGGDFDDGASGDGEPAPDGADGFGGGFGGDFEDAADADKPAEQPTPTPAVAVAPAEPKDVPAFAKFVDAVKIEWIDVMLRQLVLIVGFLGAMLATRRRKHITIDALSKVIPTHINRWIAVFTSALSVVICAVLASAGSDLVAISIEYPKELVSFADEWHFQLAFPVGFGMLAMHFAIRVIESLFYATGKAEPPEGYDEAAGVA